MRVKECWKPAPIALGIALISLSGCARVSSEPGACPPVVTYPAEFQARVADEVDTLPPGAAIETMLTDYHVMRKQALACRG